MWRSAERELDPVKRASLFIRMNDLVVREGVVIPLLVRNEATALFRKLQGVEITPWGSNLWNLAPGPGRHSAPLRARRRPA